MLCLLFSFGVEFIGVAGLMAAFIFREGKVNLTERYSVHGKPAYVIGAILAAHAPLSLAALFLLARAGVEFVQPGNDDLIPYAVIRVWLAVLVGCLVVCAAIAALTAEDEHWWKKPPKRGRRRPPPRRRRRRDEEDDEDEDDRPWRRRR
jgi:cytosine/uracil/thiamine/allantoin permease